MGENKSFVMGQLLQLKYPGKVVVFCSDDSGARRRVGYIDGRIKCLSVLAIFQKLMQDGFEKETARQYYDSLCSFYSLRGQKAMKVWKRSTSERVSVDFFRCLRTFLRESLKSRDPGIFGTKNSRKQQRGMRVFSTALPVGNERKKEAASHT